MTMALSGSCDGQILLLSNAWVMHTVRMRFRCRSPGGEVAVAERAERLAEPFLARRHILIAQPPTRYRNRFSILADHFRFLQVITIRSLRRMRLHGRKYLAHY